MGKTKKAISPKGSPPELLLLIEKNIRTRAKESDLRLYGLANRIDMTEAGFPLSISTGSLSLRTLQKIASVLHRPVFFFFWDAETQDQPLSTYITFSQREEELHMLKEKVKQLEAVVAYQSSVIKSLEEQKFL